MITDDTPDGPPSVGIQLAVIRVQLDQLIELNKTRGEDHETRIRKLEERRFPLHVVSALLSAAAVVVTVLALMLNR